MRPLDVRQYLLKYIGNHYIRAYSKKNQQTPYQLTSMMKDLYRSYQPLKTPSLKFRRRRMREVRSPGQERRFALLEKIRREDRQRIGFLCRYVMGIKRVSIPLD